MLLQARIASGIRTYATNETLHAAELQLRLQQFQVVHDSSTDIVENLYLGLVKISRLRVHDTI